jgi:hypothetical protein
MLMLVFFLGQDCTLNLQLLIQPIDLFIPSYVHKDYGPTFIFNKEIKKWEWLFGLISAENFSSR